LPAPSTRPDPLADTSALHKIGFGSTLLFVFLFISRVTDGGLGRAHLPLVMALMGIVVAALAGAWVPAMKTRVSVWYGVMGVWMTAGAPFGAWPGGTVDTIVHQWLQSVLASLLVVALVCSFAEVKVIMNTIAFGVFAAALLGLREGVASAEGRLMMNSGRFGNPNDLAFVLLLGIPLWLRYMGAAGAGQIRKAAGVVALSAILACLFRTGSRGGMSAFLVMVLVVFLRASASGKLRIAAASILVCSIGFAVLPRYLRQRYLTFEKADVQNIEGEVGRYAVGAAASSALERENNLMDSLRMTAHHPIFGVGAGNFPVAQDAMAKAAGLRRGSWLGTHNTYTQLSSECGIPVLVVFVILLAGGMRTLRAARRRAAGDVSPEAAEIRRAVLAMQTLLWGVFVFLFFAHMGYDMAVYLLIALCFVLGRAVELALAPAAPMAAPAPALHPDPRHGRRVRPLSWNQARRAG
jgi:hypothetical protein